MSGEKGAGDLISWLVINHPGEELQVLGDWKAFPASSPHALRDLEKLCFADKSTLTPGDDQSTFAKEGMRTVYLHILQMIKADESHIAAVIEDLKRQQGGHNDA